MASIVDSWYARRTRSNPSEYTEGHTAAEREIRDDRWTPKMAREYLDAVGNAAPRDAWERGYNDAVAKRAGVRSNPSYPPSVVRLTGLGAVLEPRNGYYTLTAERWSKPMLKIVRNAIRYEGAYTDIEQSDFDPGWRQVLVFEKSRKFYGGESVEPLRDHLVSELESWDDDPAQDPPDVLKMIAADAGHKTWPKIRDEDWLEGYSVHPEQPSRRKLHRDMLEQIENAAPFQIWAYWRNRTKDFLEPSNSSTDPDWKAALAWLRMTPAGDPPMHLR